MEYSRCVNKYSSTVVQYSDCTRTYGSPKKPKSFPRAPTVWEAGVCETTSVLLYWYLLYGMSARVGDGEAGGKNRGNYYREGAQRRRDGLETRNGPAMVLPSGRRRRRRATLSLTTSNHATLVGIGTNIATLCYMYCAASRLLLLLYCYVVHEFRIRAGG